jgi:hypothetical protein
MAYITNAERLKALKQIEKELIKHSNIMALAVRLALNKKQ